VTTGIETFKVSKRVKVVGPFSMGPKTGTQKSILAGLFLFLIAVTVAGVCGWRSGSPDSRAKHRRLQRAKAWSANGLETSKSTAILNPPATTPIQVRYSYYLYHYKSLFSLFSTVLIASNLIESASIYNSRSFTAFDT
jgi:hypothetical protein